MQDGRGDEGVGARDGAEVAPFDAADWERRLIAACSVHWPKHSCVELSALMAERDRLEAAGAWQLDWRNEPRNPETANWLWRFEGARRKAGLERMRAGAEAWNAWANDLRRMRRELEQVFDPHRRAAFQIDHSRREMWANVTRADFDDLVLEENACFGALDFPGVATFKGATLSGDASFYGARFADEASFDGAMFSDGVSFNGARFVGKATFVGASFDVATFDGAKFAAGVSFNQARFGKSAFRNISFSDDARFERATFTGEAVFRDARFGGAAGFEGATIGGAAASRKSTLFNTVRFCRSVDFTQATWWGPVDFTDARLGFEGAAEGAARATFTSAKSHVSFILTRARFAEVPEFHEAEFHDPPRLDNMRVEEPLGRERLPLVAKRLAEALTRGYPRGPDLSQEEARRDTLRSALRPYQLTLGACYDSDPAFEGLIARLAREMQAQLCIACPDEDAEPERLAAHRAGLARWLERAVLANVQDARFASWPMAADADVSARFRRLRKLARDAGDGDRELDFHAQELKSRRFWLDKPFERSSAARFWLGLAYEKVSDYGRSVARPMLWWSIVAFMAFLAYGALARSVGAAAPTVGKIAYDTWVEPFNPVLPPAACHSTYLASLDARSRAEPPAPWAQAAYLSLKNALVFIDWDRAEVAQRVYGCLYGVSKNDEQQAISPLTPDIPTGLSFIATLQNVLSAILIFLALLGVRNLLKIRG